MPRKNSGRRQATREWAGVGFATSIATRDGSYLMRTVPGAQATKDYRCPYCQQVIPAGTAHIVAWPEWDGDESYSVGGVAARRHWHSGCWRRQRTSW